MDNFVSAVVSKASEGSGSYPSRLLDSGISKSETMVQCKDLVFAGTDSSGMNTATICWLLASHPDEYARVRDEVINADIGVDPQGLPYLRGVVREGLRLSLANPTRLPRVVPPQGWSFAGQHIPAGTNVGVSAFEMHRSSSFKDPEKFIPERWLDPTPEMSRDWIPFGMGTRSCIAKNLATVELFAATKKVVELDLLKGAETVTQQIEILEWFNSKVKGGKIELVWR